MLIAGIIIQAVFLCNKPIESLGCQEKITVCNVAEILHL
jgi:hypothetical protein